MLAVEPIRSPENLRLRWRYHVWFIEGPADDSNSKKSFTDTLEEVTWDRPNLELIFKRQVLDWKQITRIEEAD